MPAVATMTSNRKDPLAVLVGVNIARVRRDRELRQRDLAVALDVDQSEISRWERGVHLPRDLFAVARVLSVDLTELVRAELPSDGEAA